MATAADQPAGLGSSTAGTDRPWEQAPRWHLAVHAVAAIALIAGVAAQVARPVAPNLGAPPAATSAFDAAFVARAAAYQRPLYVALIVALLLRVGVAVIVALTPWGRRVADRVVARVGRHRPARAATAVITLIVIATDLVILPLSFWAGFVHDGAYGLRTQGLAGWAYDWAVVHVPVWLGVAVTALIGYWIVRRAPRLWPPLAGLGAGLALGVVAFVSPVLLEPLSYRFEPLEPGPVRDEVERVLAAGDEDVDAILVADASRRSTRQNAYISGFGASERVVLYDTLVEQRPPAEVGVVLAHEVAHKQNADVTRFVLLSVSGGVIATYALGWVVRRRSAAGRQRGQADPSAAAVVLLTVMLLNMAAVPVQSLISRRAEAAADLGSLQLTDAPEVFADMQVGLTTANLSEPRPPRVVTWWWGSHPPAMARLAMARWWEQQ